MSAKAKAKVFFVRGGMGLKPDKNIQQVSPGRFTKSSRGVKPKPANKPFAKLPDWYPA